MKSSPLPVNLKQWLEGDLPALRKSALDLWTDLKWPPRSSKQTVPAIAMVAGTLAVWQWNSALVLSLAAGTGSGFALYQLWQKQPSLNTLKQWLQRPQAPLVLSGIGGMATLTFSYAALQVMQTFHSPSLALLLLVQDVAVVVAVCGLLWLALTRTEQVKGDRFDRCVAGLLHRHELQRLISVHQLIGLVTAGDLTPHQQTLAIEYLELLRDRETHDAVVQAVNAGLRQLQPVSRLGAESSARVIPQVVPHYEQAESIRELI